MPWTQRKPELTEIRKWMDGWALAWDLDTTTGPCASLLLRSQNPLTTLHSLQEVFLWPLESEHRYLQTYTHPSTVNTKRTVGWHQKRDR